MHVLTVLCQGGWMPIHLSEGWRRLGCHVHEFFYGTHMGKVWTDEGLKQNIIINKNLLATAKQLKSENKLDLIFAVIYDDVLTVETAQELRKLDVPMVNYHVDLVGQWYRVLKTGKYFDRVACAQKDHWSGLKQAGVRPYYLPMAANPPYSSILKKEKIEFNGVLYLGSPWIYRQQVLYELVLHGIDLKVYGRNWLRKTADPANDQPVRKNIHDFRYYLLPRIQEEGLAEFRETLERRLFPKSSSKISSSIPIDYIKGAYDQEDLIPLVQGASINLGFTHFRGIAGTNKELRQVRLREFEIPMSGGFYLTQQCQQLQELFPTEYQNISWDKLPDLLDKIDYYLKYPNQSKQVAQVTQDICLKQHTWEIRFRDLLKDLKISYSG